MAPLEERTASAGGETHQKALKDSASLTTNQGLPISDNQNSLKAGGRGPTLLEDFIVREKITHFDHERIPERIVHARGSAAHGYFQAYKSMKEFTKAAFLSDPKLTTPVFARFSTVAGGQDPSTFLETFAVSPSSFIRKKETSILSETISQSSSSRTPLSFPT